MCVHVNFGYSYVCDFMRTGMHVNTLLSSK